MVLLYVLYISTGLRRRCLNRLLNLECWLKKGCETVLVKQNKTADKRQNKELHVIAVWLFPLRASLATRPAGMRSAEDYFVSPPVAVCTSTAVAAVAAAVGVSEWDREKFL